MEAWNIRSAHHVAQLRCPCQAFGYSLTVLRAEKPRAVRRMPSISTRVTR